MNSGLVFEGNALYVSSQMILLVLAELGLKDGDFTMRVIDPLEDNHPITNMQKLYDSQNVILGTIPIVEYLYRNYTQVTNKIEETDVQTWIGMYEHIGYAPLNKMLMSASSKGAQVDKTVVRQRIEKDFVKLDEALSSKSYLTGERFTVADAVYLPMFWHFVEKCEGARELLDQYPNLSSWYDRVATQESWLLIVQSLSLKTDTNFIYPSPMTPVKIENDPNNPIVDPLAMTN